MKYLRHATAGQTDLIGPFLNNAGNPQTGLTILNTDIRIYKSGGNMGPKNSGGGTHDEIGMYQVTWDATDTDTVGNFRIAIDLGGAPQYVFEDYYILEQNIYDALFAPGASGFDADARVDVGKIEGDPVSLSFLILQIIAIKAIVDQLDSRIPISLVDGRIEADIAALDESPEAASKLRTSALTMVPETATGTPTVSTMSAAGLTEITDGHYNGRRIIWTSGGLKDQARVITGYTGATRTFSFNPTTEPASPGDTFVIV